MDLLLSKAKGHTIEVCQPQPTISMSRREFIDTYLGQAISKKLIVFLIATVALFLDKLNGSQWVIVSTSYIAIQGVTDIVAKFKDKI